MSGRVLVTGAAGFVGWHVVAAFAATGRPIRALVRGNRAAEAVETARADLLDRDAVRAAVRDVDEVVHLAGRAHVLRERSSDPLAAFRRDNVEATRILLEEAIRAGVRRFIFMSSVAAVGGEADAPLTDATCPAPTSPYGRSKLEAEQVVRALAREAGIHAPILRPPLVYGPHMKGNPLRLFRLVARGMPLPLGAVRNRRTIVYVGNLVAAVQAAAAPGAACDATFLVGDEPPIATPELIRAIGRALGRPVRLPGVPLRLLRGAGRLGDWMRPIVPSPLTSDLLDRLTGSLVLDVSGFRTATGFVSPWTLEDAMRRTAEWFLARGEERA